MASKASNRDQSPQRAYANRNQNENRDPVGDHLTLALAKVSAERNEAAAGRMRSDPSIGSMAPDQHADTANCD